MVRRNNFLVLAGVPIKNYNINSKGVRIDIYSIVKEDLSAGFFFTIG